MPVLWIILGMAIVTYLPRLLPAVMVGRIKLPPWMERWLKCVPYAALAALIIPGILTVREDAPWIGLAAGGVAALLSLMRVHVLFVMGASILAVLLFGVLT